MRFRMLLLLPLALLLALALAQTSFADTSLASSGASSCTNDPSSPYLAADDVTLIADFTCSLYDDASSYTINLAPLMNQDGGIYYDNSVVTPGYAVIIQGDPLAISDNDADEDALYNESLWEAVLYFPGGPDAGTASDSLIVYWPGAFPDASVVQSFDETEYAGDGIPDSGFFTEATGSETVYLPYVDEYDVYVPEPGTMPMLVIGLAFLGVVALKRRHAGAQVS